MLPNENSLRHVSDDFWTNNVIVYDTSDNTMSKGLFKVFDGDLWKLSMTDTWNSDSISNSSVRSQESDNDDDNSISRVFSNDCQ